jgi:predicted GNAT family N-acyltransferase
MAQPYRRIFAIESPADMARAYEIRRRVFIEEQHVPEEIELDADDARAFHALATVGADAIGCGRMLDHGDGEVKIGRMAVLRQFRGTGVGRDILRFLIDRARSLNFRKAILHAQLSAQGFYSKEGFTPVGEVFDEAGIEHRKMQMIL